MLDRFDFDLPFTTKEKDYSAPPILLELKEMSELHSARADFEVVIDHEKDVQYMPAILAGERVQFVAVGSVDAVVDLSGLGEDAIEFDPETNSVVVTLPAPTLSAPVLDHDLSHVMNRDRGLFDRLSGFFSDSPTGEAALYDAASDKMLDAAAQSGVVEKAEVHVEDLLEDMILSMGVDHVEVEFVEPSIR
ncbi:MAG: DUF4230 domain-containing protein [Ilumatobacteraceae bacterium]